MSDDITIGVTEIVNNIEVTAQPNDQIVDISVTDNADNVTLNITPTVIEINVNKGSSYAKWGDIYGTLSDQTDLQNALNLKANLVGGKVPASELPSYVDDIIEVANYAALPATGEIGKIYVTLDNNKIYRWSGSIYIEIASNSAIWGAITGTLSSQTDLVNALNLRVPYTGATSNVNLGEYGLTSGFLGLDTTPTSTPTGIGTIYWDSANRTAALIDGDGDTTLQIGQEQRILVHNNTGSTLTDGQVVYVTGSTGNLPSVSLANASSETTSAATLGVVTESIANGADGFITTSGIVNGLNTLAFNEGDLLWLGTTAGTFTATKPISPNHLVLIGYVIKKAGGNGSILVKIQNTQELEESSDVLFTSLANNQVLTYESATDLWKNKSIATILGYTPANDASVVKLTGDQTISGVKTFSNPTTFNSSLNIASGAYSILYNPANSAYWQTYVDSSNVFNFGYNGNIVKASISNSGNFTANSFIKSGGTSSQFLKADGSIDSTTYQTALTNPITGTGTTNYIPKFTGASAIGNSLIYDNGTNVGIGTTSPSYKLDVNGIISASGSGGFVSNSFIVNSRNPIWRFGNADTYGISYFQGTTGLAQDTIGFHFGTATASASILQVNQAGSVTVNGKIGIGTTSPSAKLQVEGNSIINGVSGDDTLYLQKPTGATLAISGATGTTNKILIGGSNATNPDMFVYVGGSERMRITSGGSVGIGTTNPNSNGGASTRVVHIHGPASGDWAVNHYTNLNTGANADDGTVVGIIGSGRDMYIFNYEDSNVIIGTNSAERMRITSGGNVGIGTTSPGGKLHVVGEGIFDDGTNGRLTFANASSQNDIYSTTTSFGGWKNLRLSSNELILSSGGNTERMRITSGGDVCIGKTLADWTSEGFQTEGNATTLGVTNSSIANNLFLRKNGVAGNVIAFYYDGTSVGSIAITSSTTGYYTSSDYRLKTDLKSFNGLDLVSQIKVYDYEWKIDNTRSFGVMAHELQEILPQAVTGEKDAEQMQSVDYSKIVPILVQSIQELKAEIELLKSKL